MTLASKAEPANRTGVTRSSLLWPITLALCACGPAADSGPVDVAIIGDGNDLLQGGVRLSFAGQHMRAATGAGLVALDEAGQVVPALAERWIVTDDGLSYIFRLRDAEWADGEPIEAQEVAALLREATARLAGTSLGLDLAKLTEVRAMTGRVIELRLSSPMPEFLRLLAQPELGLELRGSGAGPMFLALGEDGAPAQLSTQPVRASDEDANRNEPDRVVRGDGSRRLEVRSMDARAAIDAFTAGDTDLVLGGTLASFPMIELGPLSRGTVQVDPALGLLGLAIRRETGFLAAAERREALSMAIEREALIQPFGLGGWRAATWIVPPEQFAPRQYAESRWGGLSIDQRRSQARARVERWEAQTGQEARVSVGLPSGRGSELLFAGLAAAWEAIGVTVIRTDMDEGADLEWIDRLARYSSPRWYLNQFNCTIAIGLCSPEADDLVEQSLTERDPAAKEALLASAHAQLMADEVFVPLGVPVRWSLVRGSIDNYLANPWGLHPLFPLSQPAD
ncbi:ABC transporter substrate-binding protein [Erythrobacter sp.]|uniref:ABC transporter substrate-binding protein n=1 Tax=Erythrobacter sp. TaxID=1042 RepID=UPI002ED41C13